MDNIGRAIKHGNEATRFALDFMPKARPFSVPAAGGTGAGIMLYPGQRLSDGGIIIGKLDGIHIYVARDGTIYESVASSFSSRTLLLNDVSNRIQRSMWLATIAGAELEFVFVVAATLLGTVGTALAVSEFVCEMVDEYYEHKREVDLVYSNLRPIVKVISGFRTTCPVLFDYLVLVFLGTAGNALDRSWQGITAKDVAYFAGKFVAYAIKSGGSFAHGLKEAVVWTALIRSLGIAGRRLATEAEKTATRLRSFGQTAIGRQTLLKVAGDACVLKPDVQAKLLELTSHLEELSKNLGPFLKVVSPSI